MKILKNEKGIALIMVLVLSAIALAIIGQLIYFVTQGTKISGMGKRYKTALEASTGGADISYDLIGTRGTSVDLADFIIDIAALNPFVPLNVSCVPNAALLECTGLGEYDVTYTGLETKLKLPTDCWSGCDSSVSIDPGDTATYDMSFQLGTAPAPVYDVYVKIIDATYGNSGPTFGLMKTGVVLTNYDKGSQSQILYLYTVEVLAQNSVNPLERSKTSVLYGY